MTLVVERLREVNVWVYGSLNHFSRDINIFVTLKSSEDRTRHCDCVVNIGGTRYNDTFEPLCTAIQCTVYVWCICVQVCVLRQYTDDSWDEANFERL